MSTTEQERHELPVGWADIATKRDFDHQGESLRSEIALVRSDLRGEMAGLRGEFHRELNSQTKTLFLSLASLNLTLAALAFAAARLV